MNADQWFGMIRHALTIMGGFLVAKGMLEEGVMQEIVGGIMAAIGTGWSWYAKTEDAALPPPPPTETTE